MPFRTIVATLAVAAATLIAPSGAIAVTNGQTDGNAHPYVGLMVAHDANGVPLWRCSGSLVDRDVLLTAAHCTEAPAAHVEVWFSPGPVQTDPDYLAALQTDPDGIVSCNDSPLFDGYPCVGDVGGDPHPYPDFCNPCGNGLPNFSFRDVGIVKLEHDVSSTLVPRLAQLPSPGLVDTLANKTPADYVGYGVQTQAQIRGRDLPKPPPFYRWVGPRQRMFARGEIIAGNFTHSDEFIRFSLNPGGGKGGTCFGDSGGPDLLGGTDTVLAVNSYVTNINCAGVGYSQRVDIPEVLDWIRGWF